MYAEGEERDCMIEEEAESREQVRRARASPEAFIWRQQPILYPHLSSTGLAVKAEH